MLGAQENSITAKVVATMKGYQITDVNNVTMTIWANDMKMALTCHEELYLSAEPIRIELVTV